MKTLELLKKYTIYIGVFLLPIIFLPMFQDVFGLPKLALLAFVGSLLLVFKAAEVFSRATLELSISKFDMGILVFALAYLISALVQTPNKMEAFFLPGTASVVIGACLWYFFINELGDEAKRKVALPLFLGSLVLALVSLFSITGLLASATSLPQSLKAGNVSPLGDYVNTAIYLGTSLVLGVSLILKERKLPNKLFLSVASLIILLGVVLSIINILPNKKGSVGIIDFASSQAITFDALKENPILGVGPGNYLTAFNKFRPISFNGTPLWAAKFNSSRSFYLTVLTEAGLLGGAALTYVLYLVAKKAKSSLKSANISFIALLLATVLIGAFPPNVATITLFFIVLALNSEIRVTRLNLGGAGGKKAPAGVAALALLGIILVFLVNAGKALASEAKYKTALDYLTQNKGKETYETLQAVINASPFIDRYHITYSQVNLLLAQSLATNKDISEEDRKLMAQLIQQAIREAKSGVFLNPQRSGNWELLGSTYRAIMAFSQGGDQFAIQSYQQAIGLDPINPNLRISLGGVYYALGNYDDAIDAFKLATLAKPDHANAHYNLAAAYREKGELKKAIDEIKIVLTLVPAGSEDYLAAQKELANLESKKPTSEGETTENLTPPLEQETLINPPLPLPEEATPPATIQ